MTVWVPRAGGRPNTLHSPPLRQHFYMTWHLYGVASRFAAKWLKSKIAHAADGQPLGSISSNLAGVLLVTPKSPPGGLDGYLKRKEAR